MGYKWRGSRVARSTRRVEDLALPLGSPVLTCADQGVQQTMQIRQLLSDDDAVSPVIGVILMVAITVILAAVIASFVLGLGQDTMNSQPQASFSFDYNKTGTNVTITHDGGDSIAANELYVRGSGFGTDHATGGPNAINGSENWTEAGAYTASTDIVAGNFVIVPAESNYDIRVVYEPIEGGSSATLAQNTGPDA